jgi:hypothetical protein
LQHSVRFISNMVDPNRKDFNTKVISENFGKRGKREKKSTDTDYLSGPVSAPPDRVAALEYVKNWIKDKIIGEPQPWGNSELTVEELKAMGLVGVYIDENLERQNRRCGASMGEATYSKAIIVNEDRSTTDIPYVPAEVNKV